MRLVLTLLTLIFFSNKLIINSANNSCFQGFYKGGRFSFSFKVGPNYPHEPPKVKCETQVYHPNIDLEGNVCLNILREDWKPVLTINSIVYGLQYLFLVSYCQFKIL